MNRTVGGAADLDPVGLGDRAAVALTAYRDGRTDLLADVVRDVTPLLWRVVRAQGVPRDEAEDVVQGVWLALVRNADTVRDPQAVLKWLVVSARRAAWQAAGRRRDGERRTVALPEGENPGRAALVATDPPPDETVLTTERDRVLWRNFSRLTERCRQVLAAVAAADRPDYRSIAEVTGMPVTSVGVTRGRCLAKLRTLLAEDEGWER